MQAPSSIGRRRRAIALVVLALAAAVVSACAGGVAARNRSLGADWRASAPPRAPDDPFVGGEQLERDALVRAVLERNPSIRAARSAWKAALERYPQVTSLADPMVGYGVAPGSFDARGLDPGHKVDVSQRFPFPGKLALRGEVALAEAEAAAGDFRSVQLRLATLASLLYDERYFLARSLEINGEHLALMDEFLRIATARYEAGEASQQDPLQAEVERAHLLHRDVVLRTALRITGEQINLLLHRRPDALLPPAPAVLDLPHPVDLDREAMLDEALRRRPELHAARARVAGREAAVALARREFLPDFSLVGSYNRIWQEPELQPFVGIQVEVPLRIARRRAALEEARAHLDRAGSEWVALEDEVRFSVESGADRLEEAHHVLRLYTSRLLPAARDQVEAARAGFETGRNSFLALIGAERNLRTVRLGHQEALANASRRHAELQRAVGRLPGVPEGRLP